MENQMPEEKLSEENPDARWHRVYLAVIVTTVTVIAALWAFSRYFSK
jgi:hypothetical protein